MDVDLNELNTRKNKHLEYIYVSNITDQNKQKIIDYLMEAMDLPGEEQTRFKTRITSGKTYLISINYADADVDEDENNCYVCGDWRDTCHDKYINGFNYHIATISNYYDLDLAIIKEITFENNEFNQEYFKNLHNFYALPNKETSILELLDPVKHDYYGHLDKNGNGVFGPKGKETLIKNYRTYAIPDGLNGLQYKPFKENEILNQATLEILIKYKLSF